MWLSTASSQSTRERAMSSDCLFCRIIAGELPAAQVYSDAKVVAIRDIAPQAPTHVLLLARKHIPSVQDLGEADKAVVADLCVAAGKVAEQEGVAADGYRLVVNVGRNGGQTVDHLHVHLLGGRHLSWPPG
jgi:histidine triad (HIT) family protein